MFQTCYSWTQFVLVKKSLDFDGWLWMHKNGSPFAMEWRPVLNSRKGFTPFCDADLFLPVHR